MDITVDPHILPMYLQYERLTAKTLGQLLAGMGGIADSAAQMYGRHYATGMRMPSLEIDSAQTGESIKFTLGEGWLPSISADKDHDIVISTPRKLGIPLLVGYLMLSAAEKVLDIRSKCFDDQIKRIELKLKQQELNKIMKPNKEAVQQLLPLARDTVGTLTHNTDIRVFQVYDIDIVNVQQRGRKNTGEE